MTKAADGAFQKVPAPTWRWTGGVELFASVMLVMIGLFHLVVGLAAVLQSSFYVMTQNYVFGYDVTWWGWGHLLIGVLVGLTGAALMGGMQWARVTGIVLASVSALANFLFMPYQPVWSLLIIAIDIAVIYALATRLRELATSSGERLDNAA